MNIEQESGNHLLFVLIAGFSLLVLLLVGSAYVSIGSMRAIESDTDRVIAEQQAIARLIAEVQGEEGNMSSVFYSLASGADRSRREELQQRLDNLERALERTTADGLASSDSAGWNKVKDRAGAFIEAGRAVLASGRAPDESFYRLHQELLDTLAELTNSSFKMRAEMRQREAQQSASRVKQATILLGFGLAVAALSALFTIRNVSTMFQKLRWQASELSHLSSRVMSDQEETARRLSRELHDHFGQILSALEANLVAMRYAGTIQPERLEDCFALIKDAVGNVREVAQLLRPAILDDFGLDAGLRWLVEGFAERTQIDATYKGMYSDRLNDETETQLFRISQEALTNIARHASATIVSVRLEGDPSKVTLVISDNGKGLAHGTDSGGLGLIGMRARTRAAGATLAMTSTPGRGVTITVEVPLKQEMNAI